MRIDYGVKSAREAFDFSGASHGASIWCRTKSEAVTLREAFKDWAKGNRTRLEVTVERTRYDDPIGKGYRLHFHECTRFENEGSDIERWVFDRTKPTKRPPVGGWHITSKLYADYQRWHDENETKQEMKSIALFSRYLAGMNGVNRVRHSNGTVIIGLALKEAEIFTVLPSEPQEPTHDEIERDRLEKEQRRRSITEPCKLCRTETSVFELSNDGKCQPCVDKERAEILAISKLAENDPDAALRAKLEAKRKADRGE